MAHASPSFLLSFDFDGTLVDHEGEPPFHPALGDMLREFRRRGAAWLVNTGRGLNQTLEGIAQHNIFQLPELHHRAGVRDFPARLVQGLGRGLRLMEPSGAAGP